VLHDGRKIKLEREVDYTFQFISGDEASMHLFASWPDKFWLKFKHPDTQESIKWQGEQYFNPVLLDVVDGVPYLVVMGSPSKDNEKIYGCPELPYIYLKYEPGFFGKWLPIPVEAAPRVLRNSNLSPEYPDNRQKHLSVEDVQRLMYRYEGTSTHNFQRAIPRTYEEWNYSYKNSRRNERRRGDCRPPLKPLPDVPLPKPVEIELETVESKDYIVKGADEYYKSLWEMKGSITRANCSMLFTPPNPENLMLGERFVNDSTGSKRLPYSGPTPYPSGRMLETRTERYCNDKFIWFVGGHEELGKTVITKYTISGDLAYNIRMDNPEIADNKLARNMVLDSISEEGGYFYFYWVQSLPKSNDPAMGYPNRMTKFRFREPVHEAASN
jgi:hypothetical protein